MTYVFVAEYISEYTSTATLRPSGTCLQVDAADTECLVPSEPSGRGPSFHYRYSEEQSQTGNECEGVLAQAEPGNDETVEPRTYSPAPARAAEPRRRKWLAASAMCS